MTDSELDKLKFVTRPNPHNANWKDMKLYLYKHVYDYAISKWGSEEKLNEAYIARTENKKPAKRRTAFAKSVDGVCPAAAAADRPRWDNVVTDDCHSTVRGWRRQRWPARIERPSRSTRRWRSTSTNLGPATKTPTTTIPGSRPAHVAFPSRLSRSSHYVLCKAPLCHTVTTSLYRKASLDEDRRKGCTGRLNTKG